MNSQRLFSSLKYKNASSSNFYRKDESWKRPTESTECKKYQLEIHPGGLILCQVIFKCFINKVNLGNATWTNR